MDNLNTQPCEPAYPYAASGKIDHCGLTKLEYLAGLAMQGLLANPIYHNPDQRHNMVSVPALCSAAVLYAEMLIIG